MREGVRGVVNLSSFERVFHHARITKYIDILYLNLQNLHISFVVVSLTLYLHFSTGDSPEIYLAKETDIAAR